jgi:hypothetical protein
VDPERLDHLRADLRSWPTTAARIGGQACRWCVELLAVDGAGIMLASGDGNLITIGTTRAMDARLADLEFVLGEGPGVEAYRTGEPVAAPDLARPGSSSWAAYDAAAVRAGLGAVFSFPLSAAGTRLGALTLYRSRPGPLEPESAAAAAELALVTADALLAMQRAAGLRGTPGTLDLAVGLGFRVHHAAGMVSEQLDIPVRDALARLRAHAYAAQLPIDVVARDVIERRLRMDQLPE